MPEEVLFKTGASHTRVEIADALTDTAAQVRSGDVTLADGGDEVQVSVPETPRFEVELERLTDSETGEERYELEYEIRWTR